MLFNRNEINRTMTNLTIMKKKYKPIHVSGKRTTRQQRYFENIELKNAADRRAAQWVAELMYGDNLWQITSKQQ